MASAVGLGAARVHLLVDDPVGLGDQLLKRPQGLRGRGFSELVTCSASRRSWLAVASSRRRSGAPIRSIRSSSSSPKTVRRMISRVIACIEGAAGKVVPRGQAATWRSATSRIVSP